MIEKKNWFRRHWVLTIFMIIILLGIIISFGEDDPDQISSGDSSNNLPLNATLLIPQDLEIDRVWKISPIETTNINLTGFVEGTQRKINKVEDFATTSIVLKVYVFDSDESARLFYEQDKQRIDIRGVKEWSLGNECFGIDRDSGLAGRAEGLCLRKNAVFSVSSGSSSYDYADDGKKFMNLMLRKI